MPVEYPLFVEVLQQCKVAGMVEECLLCVERQGLLQDYEFVAEMLEECSLYEIVVEG